MCVHLCNCKFNGLVFMVSLDFKTSWKMFTQRGEYVTGSNTSLLHHFEEDKETTGREWLIRTRLIRSST